ncbi:MAG: putative membrane protein YfcA [Yoonia sp.]|jgi:uncharacterized membrane protein YfcA
MIIGLLSAMLGIGGGSPTEPVLDAAWVPIQQAISTSASVGILIAVLGTIGYIDWCLGNLNLPPGSLRFVSEFAFALTIPTSLLITRFDVELAHKLSRRLLEIAFGSFLVLVAVQFVWAILG